MPIVVAGVVTSSGGGSTGRLWDLFGDHVIELRLGRRANLRESLIA